MNINSGKLAMRSRAIVLAQEIAIKTGLFLYSSIVIGPTEFGQVFSSYFKYLLTLILLI